MNIYEQPAAAAFAYLGKRAVMLAAKLCGFKPLCLLATTVLFLRGAVSEDTWLTVMMTVICAAGGIRIADTCRDVLPLVRRSVSNREACAGNGSCSGGQRGMSGEVHDEDGGCGNGLYGGSAVGAWGPAGAEDRIRDARDGAKEAVRRLCLPAGRGGSAGTGSAPPPAP